MSKLQDGYFGNYRGTVKKHGENGYCKIFFRGVYPEEYETNIEKLPWAEPAQPLFAGGAIGNGTFQYPDIDSTVWAFFEAGNINYPIFFALTNNDKNKFIQDEFIIHYDKTVIKFNKNNNLTITADQFYPPSSADFTDDTTGDGNGTGTITFNADKIAFNSRLLDINNVTTTISVSNHTLDCINNSIYTYTNILSSNTTTYTHATSFSNQAKLLKLYTYDIGTKIDGMIIGGYSDFLGNSPHNENQTYFPNSEGGTHFLGSLYIDRWLVTNVTHSYPQAFLYNLDAVNPSTYTYPLSVIGLNLNYHSHGRDREVGDLTDNTYITTYPANLGG